MIHVIEQLTNIGLSEKEARVYLAVLELGVSSANDIARRAEIPRASGYAVLKQLVTKGLVSLSASGHEQRYAAEHPEQVRYLLDLQKSELSKRERVADNLLPRLEVFYNEKGPKPKVRYFEGIEGMRKLRSELTDYTGDIIQMLAYDTFQLMQDPADTKEHIGRLREQDANVRSILITDQQLDLYGDIVCIPPDIAPIQGEMTVLDGRVLFFSYTSGIVAIEITSDTIAYTAKTALEFAWRYAKQLV